MSPEREIAEKFKEGIETKKIAIFAPYMAEDATVDILPSSFVVVPPGGTSNLLSAMIQGRGEADRGPVDQDANRESRWRADLQGQDPVTE